MHRAVLGALVGVAAYGVWRYFTLSGYTNGPPILGTAIPLAPSTAIAAGAGAALFWAVGR